MIVEEPSRGWGIVNTHFIGWYLLMKFGTPEQQARLWPKMAAGALRAAFSMSEPELGADVAAITTSAVKDGGDYVIIGSKMWVTNGLMSGVVFVLVRTDREGSPPHRGLTCFIAEKEPGARRRLQGRRVDRPGSPRRAGGEMPPGTDLQLLRPVGRSAVYVVGRPSEVPQLPARTRCVAPRLGPESAGGAPS